MDAVRGPRLRLIDSLRRDFDDLAVAFLSGDDLSLKQFRWVWSSRGLARLSSAAATAGADRMALRQVSANVILEHFLGPQALRDGSLEHSRLHCPKLSLVRDEDTQLLLLFVPALYALHELHYSAVADRNELVEPLRATELQLRRLRVVMDAESRALPLVGLDLLAIMRGLEQSGAFAASSYSGPVSTFFMCRSRAAAAAAAIDDEDDMRHFEDWRARVLRRNTFMELSSLYKLSLGGFRANGDLDIYAETARGALSAQLDRVRLICDQINARRQLRNERLVAQESYLTARKQRTRSKLREMLYPSKLARQGHLRTGAGRQIDPICSSDVTLVSGTEVSALERPLPIHCSNRDEAKVRQDDLGCSVPVVEEDPPDSVQQSAPLEKSSDNITGPLLFDRVNLPVAERDYELSRLESLIASLDQTATLVLDSFADDKNNNDNDNTMFTEQRH